MNNSHTLGLALFALGVIIFFGQRYVIGFATMIASGYGFHEIIFQSFIAIYALSVTLIILGGVTFYKGRKVTSVTSSASAEN